VLTVHDELITEPADRDRLTACRLLMSQVPSTWAKACRSRPPARPATEDDV
jgi:hypothetical protein